MQEEPNKYYQAPKSKVVNHNGNAEPNTQTWYHATGRIGRLRYWSYQMLTSFIVVLVLGMLAGIAAALGGFSEEGFGAVSIILIIIGVLCYLAIIVYNSFIYPIRRLNDLGKSGWMCLINLIPLVNLILILYLTFAKGEAGTNEYGEPPRPNQWYHWFLAIFPIFGIGILAAVAVPAYHDYVERTAAAQVAIEEQYQDEDSALDSEQEIEDSEQEIEDSEQELEGFEQETEGSEQELEEPEQEIEGSELEGSELDVEQNPLDDVE